MPDHPTRDLIDQIIDGLDANGVSKGLAEYHFTWPHPTSGKDAVPGDVRIRRTARRLLMHVADSEKPIDFATFGGLVAIKSPDGLRLYFAPVAGEAFTGGDTDEPAYGEWSNKGVE